MSNERRGHGQWKMIANVLIDSGKYFDVDPLSSFTDELSVVKLCQNPLLRDYVRKWLQKLNQKRERTLKAAKQYYQQGNRHFDEFARDNDLPADYYTKAIFSAPKGSAILALAHLNRACCSVTSERFFEEGYSDCKLSLEFGCPKERQPILFERKLQLATLINNKQYIAETQREMKKLGIRLNKFSDSIMKDCPTEGNLSVHERNDRPKASIRNKKIIEKIGSSGQRHLVTEEDIEQHEEIYCEKAFSFVPAYKYNEPESISYACQHCATINCLPFPCYDCARVSYCSPACLHSHESIHKLECVGHQKNLWMKMGVGYLAFRTCMVGFMEAVEILQKSRPTTVDEVWSVLKLDWHEQFLYGHILRMTSPMDRLDVKTVLRYALTAQLMTTYLSDYTDFFKTLPPVCKKILANVDDWKMVVTALLLKHLVQVYFNSIAVPQIQLMPPSVYRKSYGYGSYDIHLDDLHLVLSHSEVFTSLYPRLSVVKHSCDPNIHGAVDGLNLHVYASRTIEKNEKLLTCYGPHFRIASRGERQVQLETERYFECTCKRCASNDKSWFKYYEYYCADEECNVFVDLSKTVDARWWFFMDDTEYIERINEKFVCHKCDKPLPINPDMMDKMERAALGYVELNGVAFHSSDNYIVMKNLLDLYFKVSKCMGKYHELKARLAHMVLGYCMLDSDVKLFPRLAYITMENYENRIERYGTHTLEYIMASTYALSILKMASRIERTNTLAPLARDITKIRSILNVTTIEKSLKILPPSMQMVFRYIIRHLNVHTDSSTVGDRFSAAGFNSERSIG